MPRSPKRPGVVEKGFILRLAWRNLVRHRLRTILTLTGIVIGISAIVFLLAFAYGIERLVTREVTSGNALVLLDVGTGNSQIVKINETVVGEIKSIPHVQRVYLLTGVAAKSTASNKTTDLGFFGTDQEFLKLSGIKLKTGNFFEPNTSAQIIISTSYAKFLGVGDNPVGQKVKVDLKIPKELSNTLNDVDVPEVEYTVSGVFQDDSGAKAYTSSQNLEKLGLANFTQVKVEADFSKNIATMRKQIEGLGLQTQYVGDTVNQINSVFAIFKAILASFGIVTLAVSLLGMFNTLTISLLERMKEVALMKILGMRRKDISYVFLAESLLLGTTGGVIGILFGLLFGKLANIVLNWYAASSGGSPVLLFYYPTIFIVTILILAVGVGLMTGWYPSRRATRVNALDVIRYE